METLEKKLYSKIVYNRECIVERVVVTAEENVIATWFASDCVGLHLIAFEKYDCDRAIERAVEIGKMPIHKIRELAGLNAGSAAADLIAHLHRQRDFSLRTFGPGARVDGVLDHIEKELQEVRENPTDLEEWIDVVMLALDGAWRAGYSPEQIAIQLEAKQTKNENRDWPDWRTSNPNKAIEHIKSE